MTTRKNQKITNLLILLILINFYYKRTSNKMNKNEFEKHDAKLNLLFKDY